MFPMAGGGEALTQPLLVVVEGVVVHSYSSMWSEKLKNKSFYSMARNGVGVFIHRRVLMRRDQLRIALG